MGATPLRYPLRFAKVKGAESDGAHEVPIALAEVEGAEPGGALAVVEVRRASAAEGMRQGDVTQPTDGV